MPVLPGAEPFRHDASRTPGTPGESRVGVLLCHGFTGTPQSLRPWAHALVEAGFSVRLPLLPGHGTSWQQCNRTGWHDWYHAVERALLELREDCDTVVVAGLSMGGALALRLAQRHSTLIDGLVLVNPSVRGQDVRLRALPVLRGLLGSIAGIASDIKAPGQVEVAYDRTPLHALHSVTQLWEAVSRDLAMVTQPVLLLRSRVDHVVPAVSSATVLARISSRDVTEVVLADSYHVATLDNDAELIFAESIDFVRRLAEARVEQDAAERDAAEPVDLRHGAGSPAVGT